MEAPPKYHGVSIKHKLWEPTVRLGKTTLHLGLFVDPAQAARVADFARFVIFGNDPACRERKFRPVAPFNFPPPFDLGVVDRAALVRKILEKTGIDRDVVAKRLDLYDSLT